MKTIQEKQKDLKEAYHNRLMLQKEFGESPIDILGFLCFAGKDYENRDKQIIKTGKFNMDSATLHTALAEPYKVDPQGILYLPKFYKVLDKVLLMPKNDHFVLTEPENIAHFL